MTILNSLYLGIVLFLLGIFILYRSIIVSKNNRDRDITETRKAMIIQNYFFSVFFIIIGIVFILKNV